MDEKAKLYETLGELLYVISMADGGIQAEEKSKLEEILQNHKFGKEILWSFNYEEKKGASVEDLYKKVINYCHSHGPTAEFEEFINSMEAIAMSSNGMDKDESKVISSFSMDLIERFKKDLADFKKK